MTTRRLFNLLLPLLPSSLLAKTEHGVTVKLTGLDPRFVEAQRVAAASRQLTLEQWFVHTAYMMSGYDLSKSGFIEKPVRL